MFSPANWRSIRVSVRLGFISNDAIITRWPCLIRCRAICPVTIDLPPPLPPAYSVTSPARKPKPWWVFGHGINCCGSSLGLRKSSRTSSKNSIAPRTFWPTSLALMYFSKSTSSGLTIRMRRASSNSLARFCISDTCINHYLLNSLLCHFQSLHVLIAESLALAHVVSRKHHYQTLKRRNA